MLVRILINSNGALTLHNVMVFLNRHEDNNEILVINKPSSVPIHPCGRYRHNSVLYILAKEHGYRNLRGSRDLN